MRDQSFDSLIEKEVRKLKGAVKILKSKEVAVTANLKVLEEIRNEKSKEIIELEDNFAKKKKECQEKIDSMLEKAQEKVNVAISKEAEASALISSLKKREKEADDLIKSNEGLKANLEKNTEILEEKIKVINEVKALINEKLK